MKKPRKLSEAKNVKPQSKKLNPFEVHINRKKYDILGMKSKAEKGLPGISRSKSLKKRKRTLLQEYKFKDKKNMFVDKRIGERNSAMTAEDKILARYTAERMRFHSKKSIYNLGDDEELTHKGQTLTEVEKFDNPRSEDEDEDDEEEDNGKLDSNFVGDAHFGGGIFKKVEGESKSRKDLIDQLIAESIKRKAEKRQLREQTFDLTQKLDSKWKELLPLVTASKKSKDDIETERRQVDDKFANYDIISKKLKFEPRGKAGERLKSEEEMAKEEKERLEKLEKDRIQRMMGETNPKEVKHRSADDMDDGFDLGNEPETLCYANGVLTIEGKENSDSEEDVKEKKEEEEMDSDEKEEGESESDGGENENSDAEDSDNLSDLKESEDEDPLPKVNNLEGEKSSSEETKKGAVEKADASEVVEKDVEESEEVKKDEEEKAETSELVKKDAEKKAEAMEAARKELPYTFDIPKDYEEFAALMEKYDPDFQAVVIERMIKCHHPRLKAEFKDDLDLLFTFLLQHLQDSASQSTQKLNCFKILDRLAPWLYDLTQWNPEACASGIMEVLKEKYEDFLKRPKSYPSLDTFVFLKLTSLLFPTSDYRHPVVTPSLIFLQQMLFQCRVRSSVDLSRGLLVATLALEYCALSKRLVLEAVSFIYGVLRLAHPPHSDIPILPPFEFKNENSFNLNITDKSRNLESGRLRLDDLVRESSSEDFKINSLALALNLLSEFCDFLTGDQSAIFVFEPFLKLLDSTRFSSCLKNKVEKIIMKMEKFQEVKLRMLVLEKKKPLPLRLYEPNIEEVYSLKKYRPMGKKKTERAKLMHRYKREMKGALREIRKDRAFITKLKYKETLKSDMERQRKVREILGSAAEQAGELNKLLRKKKK